MRGASDEIQRKYLQNVCVLEEKISEVENELHEASEEGRNFTVERRKAEADGLRASDTSDGQCQWPKVLKVKLGSVLQAVPGRRNVERRRVSDPSKVVLSERTVSRAQRSDGEAGIR